MGFEAATLTEEQFSALPEPLQAQFEPGDNGYVQRDPGAAPASALKAEREAAKKLREELAQAQERMKSAPDPEKYAELQAKLDEIEQAKLKAEGNTEELHKRALDSLRNAKEKEIAERDEKIAELTANLEKVLIEDRGVSAVAAVKGFDGEKPGNMRLLKSLLRESLKLHEGQPVPYDGDQPMLVEGRPMTLEEWAAELPKSYPGFFQPSTGGGATNQSNGGTPSKQFQGSPEERLRQFYEQGGVAN